MKNQKKRKGQMYAYFQWPLYLGVLVICMNVVVGAINLSAGLVMFFFTLIYLGIAGAILCFISGKGCFLAGGISRRIMPGSRRSY